MTNHEEIAATEDLRKRYRPIFGPSIQALDGVSLSIHKGEVFGLLGPNRAGKTTLLKILLSICRPTSGVARRFTKPIKDRSTLAKIGYMHENQAFPKYLTAQSLLKYYGTLAGVSSWHIASRSSLLLTRVGLSDRAHEPISRFSKGMVQRLALAQALLNEPELLVLDEPMEGLDVSARKLIHEILDEQRRIGRTAILVTHNVSDVEKACDRIAVLSGGKLAFLGAPAELMQQRSAATFENAILGLYSGQSA